MKPNLAEMYPDITKVIRKLLSILAATIVSVDGCLSGPIQLGAKALLSRAAQVCPSDKSLWQTPIANYDPGLAKDCDKYFRTIRHFRDIEPMERHLMEHPDQLEEVLIFSDGSLAFAGYLIYFGVREGDHKVMN